MGMFDSIYDPSGVEWQTKAFERTLAAYRVGQPLPGPATDYQIEVLGEPRPNQFEWTFATIRNGLVSVVPDKRIEDLPLLAYSGGWLAEDH